MLAGIQSHQPPSLTRRGQRGGLINFRKKIAQPVFTDEDTLIKVLKEPKEADLGVSIIVSGLLEKTAECCHKADIEPHTIEYSLGIFG